MTDNYLIREIQKGVKNIDLFLAKDEAIRKELEDAHAEHLNNHEKDVERARKTRKEYIEALEKLGHPYNPEEMEDEEEQHSH